MIRVVVVALAASKSRAVSVGRDVNNVIDQTESSQSGSFSCLFLMLYKHRH